MSINCGKMDSTIFYQKLYILTVQALSGVCIRK